MKKLKRLLVCLLVLVLCLSVCACGGSKKETVLTEITLGMTLAEAQQKEPSLTVEKEHTYACEKSFAGVDGTLYIIILTPPGKEAGAYTIGWNANPEDGTGKPAYDALLAALKKQLGAPDSSNDSIQTGAAGTSHNASARWLFDDCSVFCSYIETPETGLCQLQYRKASNP